MASELSRELEQIQQYCEIASLKEKIDVVGVPLIPSDYTIPLIVSRMLFRVNIPSFCYKTSAAILFYYDC